MTKFDVIKVQDNINTTRVNRKKKGTLSVDIWFTEDRVSCVGQIVSVSIFTFSLFFSSLLTSDVVKKAVFVSYHNVIKNFFYYKKETQCKFLSRNLSRFCYFPIIQVLNGQSLVLLQLLGLFFYEFSSKMAFSWLLSIEECYLPLCSSSRQSSLWVTFWNVKL